MYLKATNRVYMGDFLNSLMGSLLRPVLRGMGKGRVRKGSGDVVVEGAKGPIEVRRDAQGVPYVYAGSNVDAFFGQGYVHCQDRLWQMEVNRRLSQGRLGEVFGRAALNTDRMARTFGFARIAEEDMKLLDGEMQDYLQAYCDGVNACLKGMGKRLPIEFKLAGFAPAPWTPLDVLAFTRLMTFQLSYGWGHELARARLYGALGPELAKELDVRYNPAHPVVLPDGLTFQALDAEGVLGAIKGPFLHELGGSNAWAVSGSRTDTGKPYLCSDPHLALLLPSIWYQIYLEGGDDLRVQGVSIPGMPLVMIGHNRHIGWGVTLAFSDIQDLYVEQFKDGGSDEYLYGDEWHGAKVVEEEIRLKGEKGAVVERVRITRHGPVISDALALPYQGAVTHKLSLCSPALRSSTITLGWYGLDRAKGWDDFVEAQRHVSAPGLNIVYADVHGNIGYRMTGETPIRAKGMGEFPQPGWTGEYEWVGTVPFEEMPCTLNPVKGVVVSCNNKVVPDDFPHFMGNIWMNGYRAARVEHLLAQKEVWSLWDFPAIHMDIYCAPGVVFAGHFRGVVLPEGARGQRLGGAVKLLLEWDGYLDSSSVAGTLYQVCRRMTVKRLFEAASKDKAAYPWVIGKGMEPLVLKVSEFQGKDTEAMLELLGQPESQLLKLAGGKDVLLVGALEETLGWLEQHYGADMRGWEWGRLHQVVFPHAMGIKKPLDKVFNIGPIPAFGDTDTVCQTSMQPELPYMANLACPSYRQILDFADFNRSVWVMPPGQSGQLGSGNYGDQVGAWMEGRYFPMLWERGQVEKGTVEVMWLRPGRG